ncbi:Oidioi.mRNA.OKI2018_I69.XSR.g14331.t1.cds [Oikopleura dioica]|uniref:Oidioi.mRNA.OKI2018_I69.XSR.g14331.t1.cds n=1 Tax=Oikopleura dioica TaxID=34765 RepID=A0ABN7S9H6_OIKDI|nr:Oidioi.mRNA.OKI2018_I69.XSR.g14331.t1.cds [Oikopleura dioica]
MRDLYLRIGYIFVGVLFWSANHLSKLYEIQVAQEKYFHDKIKTLQRSNIRQGPEPIHDEKIPTHKIKLPSLPKLPSPNSNGGLPLTSEKEDDRNNAVVDNTLQETPINDKFIFYNKMPRAGSSTLYAIIQELSGKHKFTSQKISSGELRDDNPAKNEPIIQFLKGKSLNKYFLTKTHYWLDFAEYEMKQPTFINLIRDPVEWFESRYNFKRRHPINTASISERETFERPISKCVLEEFDECSTRVHQPWLLYLCGTSQTCKDLKSKDKKRRKKAIEFTKTNIAQNFYLIGLMEDFDLSLKMFEHALPRYFNGATKLMSSHKVQAAMKASQSANISSLNPLARKRLATVLADEIDVFEYTKSLFYQKVKDANINL